MDVPVVDTAQGYHNEDRELTCSTTLYLLPSTIYYVSFIFYPPMLPLCVSVSRKPS